MFLLTAAYYRGAHAIVAVFDLNDIDTLKSAERWVNEALQTTAVDNPLIFLVGSKRDLIVNKIFIELKYFLVFRQMKKFTQKLIKQLV
jgi:GTPase SAR1 family protein